MFSRASPRLRTKPLHQEDQFQMDADGMRAAPGFGAVSVLMPPAVDRAPDLVPGGSLTSV